MQFVRSLAARFTEPSSWSAVTMGLAAVGLNLPNGAAQYVAFIGAGLAGLLTVIIPEGK
ncbi:MAG: hypothetical protein IT481_08660 [Gammaproteobacteria bacterium]|nr:hypothetical protein [Gammaproteobacteria bacterium]